MFWSDDMEYGRAKSVGIKSTRNTVKYTQRKLFEILLNHNETRLYLPLSDWFGTKPTSIWFQINRKMVNTIWFRVDLIIFWKYFSARISVKGSALITLIVLPPVIAASTLNPSRNSNISHFFVTDDCQRVRHFFLTSFIRI